MSKTGFTLTEVVVYVGLLGALSVFIGNFLIQSVGVYQRARAEREVLSNGRLLLQTIRDSASQASELYTPTSRFNVDSGQLSLLTPATSTPGHAAMYVDFWIDNGRMWMREEGAAALPLSAASVRVSRFYLEYIPQGLERDALKITLRVDAGSRYPSSIILHATAALRGNY